MIDLSNVDVPDLMWHLSVTGARSASGGQETNFSCPFDGHSHGDENPSAYMNNETTAWFCWGCKRRGKDCVSFVAQVQGVAEAQAQRYLRELYGIEFDEPISGSMVAELDARWAVRPAPTPPSKPSASWLRALEVDWPSAVTEPWAGYIYNRGFARRTLEEWSAGYDFSTQRITFPVYDVDGELVGIKARAWDDENPVKYLVMGDRNEGTRYGFVPYQPTDVVYGLHREREWPVVVVNEGELNAWACQQAGIKRPVAIGMSYLSARHAALIIQNATMAILFFDPDKAGGQVERAAIAALEPFINVAVVRGHDRDAAQYQKDGESSTIIDLCSSAISSLHAVLL